MDFTCEIDGCEEFASQRRHCPTHKSRLTDYGSPTPLMKCYGCYKEFIWIDKKLYNRAYCNDCKLFFVANEQWIPKYWANIQSHGLSGYDFLKKLESQNYSCGNCRELFIPKQKIVIDHNHECDCSGNRGCKKCVRDLLCNNCNVIIGWLEKHPDKIEAGRDYLERHRTVVQSLAP